MKLVCCLMLACCITCATPRRLATCPIQEPDRMMVAVYAADDVIAATGELEYVDAGVK